jgi:hypothetical protein
MVLICTIILRLTELFSCYKPVLVGLPFEPRFLICTPPVSVDLVKEGRRFNFCVRLSVCGGDFRAKVLVLSLRPRNARRVFRPSRRVPVVGLRAQATSQVVTMDGLAAAVPPVAPVESAGGGHPARAHGGSAHPARFPTRSAAQRQGAIHAACEGDPTRPRSSRTRHCEVNAVDQVDGPASMDKSFPARFIAACQCPIAAGRPMALLVRPALAKPCRAHRVLCMEVHLGRLHSG